MKTFLSPLNAKEEQEYLSRLKEGDREAKQVLIERNMRLVAHVTKKYQNSGEDMEDLISIGTDWSDQGSFYISGRSREQIGNVCGKVH